MRPALLFLFFLSSACSPTVGTACDTNAARTVAYDATGTPAYAGQAMLLTSCAGGGSACHASDATHRYAAPFGLDFDPILADDPRFADEPTGAAHLYGAQRRSHDFRDSIFARVSSGADPPRGIGDEIAPPPYRTFESATDAIGTPLPSIRSAEGRELLRNWLACGSPVVEATTIPAPVVCASDADCPVTHRCETSHGQCSDVGWFEPRRTVP